MSTKDPRSLIVLAFDSSLRAQEALLAFMRMSQDGTVLLQDAVFFQKDDGGKVRVIETVDVKPSDAAVRGSLWGALFGTLLAGPIGLLAGGAVTAGVSALVAKLTDIGIPDADVTRIGEALAGSSVALAVLISHVKEAALVTELQRFAGARLVEASLSPATVEALQGALRGPASAT